MTQVQSKLLNIRISPELYNQFKQKVSSIGLNPSSFLRHVIISTVISDKVTLGNTFKEEYKSLIKSLKKNSISENEALKLADKEKEAMYNKA
ncbi:hypothetical protein A3F03_03220 [Candidatus Roizmanbacteria bacterium RIFCSPHIGHO2_12_FULL_41_11]|uniref:Uncharacterized protein n=3 Tax=Candidatus Roizmaniibacteriota TaxID=1752723 RepID=A0A1F7JQB8_9BACT|nr:MAG: hypothetical protein A3F03_03220 [Candidatus Roizmanbacteria bacterium RIFCSPHIGHO2_12_FULL_41_11]OGK52694.1 MAG: hypothetical protein A2966_02545 [Candidatus Roizmanbacteria bacterium RIFCSPLOWO2_01_FULL_41_22]OGK57805.1 MAG: hypothetical protein A3H86_01715 [Candidatus Roizmanbacteria bacterium RIFCSPLOWO2_02_FULL_41_9]